VNKTLTITIYQDPTKHVEKFMNDWHQFGTIEQISDMQYRLIGPGDKTSVLSMNQFQLMIEGEIPSVSFMIIDTLSKACEADKVIEGEVIDKNQTAQPDFNNPFGGANGAEFKIPLGMSSMMKISGMSKFKLILLLIVALPILIVMIPVMIVFAIVKIIMFKLKFK
jgi:hypothetical protein